MTARNEAIPEAPIVGVVDASCQACGNAIRWATGRWVHLGNPVRPRHMAVGPTIPPVAPPVAPDAEKKARRERIATAVLAGIAAIGDGRGTIEEHADTAIAYADALIAALDVEA